MPDTVSHRPVEFYTRALVVDFLAPPKGKKPVIDQTSSTLRATNPLEIISTLREGLLLLAEDLTVEFASDRFFQMFRVKKEETLGRCLAALGDGQWSNPALLEHLRGIVVDNLVFEDIEIEHRFDHIGRKVMRLNARKTVSFGSGAPQILLAIDDVTEAADLAREISRQKLLAEGIVDTLREPLLVLDGELKIIAASRAFYLKFQVGAEQAIGKRLVDLGNGQWANSEFIRLLVEVVPAHSTIVDYEITHVFPHIGERTVLLNACKIFSEDNNIEMLLLAMEDVTERRRLESERDIALDQSQRLLDELNHRMMNSLSMIGSVIAMEARTLSEGEGKAAFSRMRNRIDAIGTLYRLLTRKAAVDSVNAQEYLSAIITDAVAAMEMSRGAIKIDLFFEDIKLSTRIAVPLGLITNELSTNCLKYAYNGRACGTLGLQFVTVQDGVEFTIWDDGSGIEENARVDSGLGQKLVEAFVQQIGGVMRRTSGHNGTRHTLVIPRAEILRLQD